MAKYLQIFPSLVIKELRIKINYHFSSIKLIKVKRNKTCRGGSSLVTKFPLLRIYGHRPFWWCQPFPHFPGYPPHRTTWPHPIKAGTARVVIWPKTGHWDSLWFWDGFKNYQCLHVAPMLASVFYENTATLSLCNYFKNTLSRVHHLIASKQ